MKKTALSTINSPLFDKEAKQMSAAAAFNRGKEYQSVRGSIERNVTSNDGKNTLIPRLDHGNKLRLL